VTGAKLRTSTPAIFSVDVEDWFHVLEVEGAPRVEDWDGMPSRVEIGFRRLLDLFDEKQVSVTCFFLGWTAERHPDLVREAHRRGHEIASHGHRHRLVWAMAPDQLRDDARRAREVLEQIIGEPVLGFRAPGFSVTRDTPWFFERLARAGYRYDSSVFPARRAHGGLPGAELGPHSVATPAGTIIEVPVSVVRIAGASLCCFGGGYLRLAPYPLIRAWSRRVISEGRPVVYYAHPREVDPDHPRLPMSPFRRFKSYTRIRGTYAKISRLLDDFTVTTFAHSLGLDHHADD